MAQPSSSPPATTDGSEQGSLSELLQQLTDQTTRLIAGAMALVGRSRIQAGRPPVPEQAVESVKEDIQETKQKAKEGRG